MSDVRMRDIPMLDSDRERFTEMFPDFASMTLEEFRDAYLNEIDELLDLMNTVRAHDRRFGVCVVCGCKRLMTPVNDVPVCDECKPNWTVVQAG